MIENQIQYEITLYRRAELRQSVEQVRAETGEACARELTIQSLKRRSNRFTEEIVRCESQQHSKPVQHQPRNKRLQAMFG